MLILIPSNIIGCFGFNDDDTKQLLVTPQQTVIRNSIEVGYGIDLTQICALMHTSIRKFYCGVVKMKFYVVGSACEKTSNN